MGLPELSPGNSTPLRSCHGADRFLNGNWNSIIFGSADVVGVISFSFLKSLPGRGWGVSEHRS